MEIKVSFLFSKNNLIGSKAISWGTEHLSEEKITPSHIAILVNDRWVFESTLSSGVRVVSYEKWLKINKEVAKIEGGKCNYSKVKDIFKSIKGKKYDWCGATYLGVRIGLNKFFKIHIPKENKWDDKDKYFCCEAVEKLTHLSSTNMKSPTQLLENFRKNGCSL